MRACERARAPARVCGSFAARTGTSSVSTLLLFAFYGVIRALSKVHIPPASSKNRQKYLHANYAASRLKAASRGRGALSACHSPASPLPPPHPISTLRFLFVYPFVGFSAPFPHFTIPRALGWTTVAGGASIIAALRFAVAARMCAAWCTCTQRDFICTLRRVYLTYTLSRRVRVRRSTTVYV